MKMTNKKCLSFLLGFAFFSLGSRVYDSERAIIGISDKALEIEVENLAITWGRPVIYFEILQQSNCFDISYNQLKYFYSYFLENEINPDLAFSILLVESEGKLKANSYKGAKYGRGLMQVSEIALKDFNLKNKTNYKPDELYNFEINLEIACWTLKQGYKYYEQIKSNKNQTIDDTLKEEHILAIYNRGVGMHVNKYKENIDYTYINKIQTKKLQIENFVSENSVSFSSLVF